MTVIASSARRTGCVPIDAARRTGEICYLWPPQWATGLAAVFLLIFRFGTLRDVFRRALREGDESPATRLKALLHTWLGACYALQLRRRRVQHLHVHHGYFSAWIAMVAARLLGIEYSLTLHGSDVLCHAAFLDFKLANCQACFTVSEYNRAYILRRYKTIASGRLFLRRLGVEPVPLAPAITSPASKPPVCMVLLSVGRLHPVKNHAFLLDACAVLKSRGANLLCLIAGEGPERGRLEQRIASLGLAREVKLLGHVAPSGLDSLYPLADLVVLTSRSEGIPVVLMEAMAHGRPVLAPRITGIPELVIDGQTGFLYRPGSLIQFVTKIETIYSSPRQLEPIRAAGRRHIATYFHRRTNLEAFSELFLQRVLRHDTEGYENPVLQQI